jgi:hypothetical protein
VSALVGAAALLLLAAGARKVADPRSTTAALAARGWRPPAGAVRAGALAEAALGAAMLAVGGRAPAALVAVVYAAYAVWVATALRAGAPCGCFGEPGSPARPAHLAVDAGFALAAAVGAVVGIDALVDAGPAVIAAALLVAGVAYLVLAGRPLATR